jgi:hypothetical protein
MKKYLLTACAVLLTTTSIYAVDDLDDDYPMTQEERKEREIGSVLGGEGIVFRPGSVRNESTIAAGERINKFLWQASLEMVDVAPITFIDAERGVLSTDWYSYKDSPNTSRKLTTKVVGNTISPESINVTVKQRTKKGGIWVEDSGKSRVASDMEAKILNRARELFVKSKK